MKSKWHAFETAAGETVHLVQYDGNNLPCIIEVVENKVLNECVGNADWPHMYFADTGDYGKGVFCLWDDGRLCEHLAVGDWVVLNPTYGPMRYETHELARDYEGEYEVVVA